MPRYKFTSRARGPRVIRPIEGPARAIAPGRSITAEVAESHLRYLLATREFEIVALREADPAQPLPMFEQAEVVEPVQGDLIAGDTIEGDTIEGDGSGEALPPIEESDAAPAAETEAAPDFDAMSDEELRGFVADKDGRQPHPATSREKLLAKARGD